MGLNATLAEYMLPPALLRCTEIVGRTLSLAMDRRLTDLGDAEPHAVAIDAPPGLCCGSFVATYQMINRNAFLQVQLHNLHRHGVTREGRAICDAGGACCCTAATAKVMRPTGAGQKGRHDNMCTAAMAQS